jgi:ligand-binding SRPBCC domain-containing protein
MKKNQNSNPFIFETYQKINQPISDVFSFFSQAENLQKLTPPWLKFKFLSPLPIDMKKGTLIDYKLQIMGIPLKWRTEITIWEPPYRFVDEQLSGPYKLWRHEHFFVDEFGVTHMRDTVQYDFWGLFLKNILKKLLIEPQIRKIFDFRFAQINRLFNNERVNMMAKRETV